MTGRAGRSRTTGNQLVIVSDGREGGGVKMEWIDVTLILVILAYVITIAWFTWRRKKEKNPQDYIGKHILTIELWIISIFLMIVMRKVTVLIAW